MSMRRIPRHRLALLSVATFAIASMGSALASAPKKAQPASGPSERPNIVLILADDLGFSDLGAFGGEISTPNLDALALRGLRLTGMHTAPTCSPSRSMLMTGADNHEAGLGAMREMLTPELRGKPGYEGYLTTKLPTLPQRLKEAGYWTAMSGKWHLGIQPGQYPADRGFDASFALLQGGHNHFGADQNEAYDAAGVRPTYVLGKQRVDVPVGAYSSDHFTDRMIELLGQAPTEKPVFAYLAFTAPHWPLQAPPELIAKYKGKYDAGPAALAQARRARMEKLGLVAPGIRARPIDDQWSRLSAAERMLEARKMEIYAAMVERLDSNVGRLIDSLRRSGRLENTLFVFMSDNGAEGHVFSQRVNTSSMTAVGTAVDNSIDNMGKASSFVSYGPHWASAAMAPYAGYKAQVYEGGILSPGIVAGPNIGSGRISNATLHIRDVMPTLLAVAGSRPTSAHAESKSSQPLLNGKARSVRNDNDVMFWEFAFQRALRQGKYKITYSPILIPVLGARTAPGSTKWQLYDLSADPGETTDLADRKPAVLRRLVKRWYAMARRHQVVLPDGEERE